MTEYRNLIKINERFQNAINLSLDLNSLEKINAFIPTRASMDVLKKLLLDVEFNSNTRANVVVGPYGKGKSHLYLVLLGIISIKNDETQGCFNAKSVFDDLIERIKVVDLEVSELINRIRQSEIRLMPVLVNSNYSDLKQAFLVGLKSALESFKLAELTPPTYFEAVIDVVERWKIEYEATYEHFVSSLKQHGKMSIVTFLESIASYDKGTYDLFCEIHPKITSGSVFNPLTESNTVKLFFDVNERLISEHAYNGMFVVFDEFSKYLESSIKSDIVLELKMLQDFAEAANRTKVRQFHISCIAHKGISEYTNHIPKRRIDPYRAVEGRFKEIHFTASIESSYELIANTIVKDKEAYSQFLNENHQAFAALKESVKESPFFLNNPVLQDLIVEECFPLNPLASYALLQVCEKSAQNERTLFTFLSRAGEGLDLFIKSTHLPFELLGLDRIYDYFEQLFLKDLYNPKVREFAIFVSNVASKLDLAELKFVKALAVVLIIDDDNYFCASEEVICPAMQYDSKTYEELINRLVRKGIIKLKRIDGTITFAKKSSKELQLAIMDQIELERAHINIRIELEKAAGLGYVIPRQYNDHKEMTRFFKHVYITCSELLKTTNFKAFYPEEADGYVFNLLYSKEDNLETAISKYYEIGDEYSILRIPNEPFAKFEELLEWKVIGKLIERKFNDDEQEMYAEYDFLRDDLEITIKEYVDFQFNEKNVSNYYLRNKKDESKISRIVASVCYELYNLTPILNNEMINKRHISSQIKIARAKAIDYIFTHVDHDINSLAGSSPDITILRSLFKSGEDNNSKSVYKIVGDFLLSCEGRKRSFAELYAVLTSKPYGLRANIIPLFIANEMKKYLADISIYLESKEVLLNGDVIGAIESKPDRYYMVLDHGSGERIQYTENMLDLFNKYIYETDKSFNNNMRIVQSIGNYIKSLPRVVVAMARAGKLDSDKSINGIKYMAVELVKSDINPRDVLFDYLPSKFEVDDYVSTYNRILSAKETLDNYLINYKTYICDRLLRTFTPLYKGSLKSALSNWLSEIPTQNRNRIYNRPIPDFIKLIEEPNGHDDHLFINKLAKIITKFSIEDWTIESEGSFWSELNLCQEQLLDNISEEKQDVIGELIISYDGEYIKRTVTAEISFLGKTLLNSLNTVLNEYGDSLTDEEKAKVLIELLKQQI